MKKLACILIVVAFISCSLPDPDKVGLPSWETKLSLYILNDSWNVAELAEEDSTLYANEEGELIFSDEFYEEELIIIDTDMIEDYDVIEKGDIEINDPEPRYSQLPITLFVPGIEDLHGLYSDIPPADFEIFEDLDEFEEFITVHFISGMILVYIYNNTVIWLGDEENGNPLIFRLYAKNNNELLAELVYQDISPDSHGWDFIDLEDEIFPNELYFSLSGGSPGSKGQKHYVDDEILSSFVETEIDFEGIDEESRPLAKYAHAIIPEQEINDIFYVPLDDNVVIYKGIIDFGRMYIDIKNKIDVNIFTTIFIDDLFLRDEEESFRDSFIIERNGEVFLDVELENAVLGKGVNTLDSLMVRVEAFTIDTSDAPEGDRYRELYHSDYIEFFTNVDELTFEYLKATVYEEEQEVIDGVKEIEIEYPDIEGDLEFVGESSVKILVDTPLPATLKLKLVSENYKGEQVKLDEKGYSGLPVFSLEPGLNQIIFDSEEFNINEMLSILPDKFVYQLYPVIGDSTVIFEYYKGDMMVFNVSIESDISLYADCWVVPSEDNLPKNQNIDSSDFEEKYYNAIKNAKLKVQYTNSTGMTQAAKILLGDKKFLHFDDVYNPKPVITILDIPFLDITADTLKTMYVNVEQDDLVHFLADSVFVVPKLKLVSDGETPFSGEIYMNAVIEVILEISQDLIEEE